MHQMTEYIPAVELGIWLGLLVSEYLKSKINKRKRILRCQMLFYQIEDSYPKKKGRTFLKRPNVVFYAALQYCSSSVLLLLANMLETTYAFN